MRSVSLASEACVPNPDGSCSICGDEAIPAVVERIDAAAATAEVRTSSGGVTVAIDLLDEISVGDTVMIHLGFAIGHLAQGASETIMAPGVDNAKVLT